MYRSILFLFVVSLVCAAGCRTPQTLKNSWKETRSYYYAYLNTPAKLDMDAKGNLDSHEAVLAAAVADFDLHLRELERALQNSDRNPDPMWVNKITTRFPWLAGLALTDATGNPRAKVPMEYAKPFDIGTLGAEDTKQLLKDLRAYMQDTPQGQELYIANPVYHGGEFQGLIIVHFDPRTLIARAADPAKFMLASPKGIVWPGIYRADSTPIASINWGEVTKDSSYGTVSNASGTFFWLVRYIGNLPLVYAVKVKGDFPEQPENLTALDMANTYALGPVDPGTITVAPIMQQLMPADSTGEPVPGEVGDMGKPNVAPASPPAGSAVPAQPKAEVHQLPE